MRPSAGWTSLYPKFIIFTILPYHFLLTWNLSFFDRFLYHIIHDFIFSGQANFLIYCKAWRSQRFSPLCLADFQISFLEQNTEGIWCFIAWHSVISVYVCFKIQKTVVAVLTSFDCILTFGVQEIYINTTNYLLADLFLFSNSVSLYFPLYL